MVDDNAELARLRVDLETVTLQRDSMRMEAERAGAELARLREPVGDVGEVMRRLQAGICDDKCKIMNVSGGCDCAIAAELLLRQAGEIEEAQRRYDGVYAQWGLAAKLCDEHRTRAETAEARGYAAAREQAVNIATGVETFHAGHAGDYDAGARKTAAHIAAAIRKMEPNT